MFDTNKAKGPIKKNIAPNLKRLRGLWKNDPDQIFPVAGASIIPNIGIVLSINAILTVKFPSLLINPLVPSSGSTNQYGPLGFWFSEWKVSSEIKMLKPVEPYKGKGIKERGQYVIRKEGKKK